MSLIQKSISCLIVAFDEYASKDGDSKTLSKAELKQLLLTEFEMKPDDKAFNEIFKTVDISGDQLVDFHEFLQLVGAVGFMIHSSICAAGKPKK